MKEWLGYQLDELKSTVIEVAVLRIQRYLRGFLTRKQYKNMKKSSLIVQAAVRGWMAKLVLKHRDCWENKLMCRGPFLVA